MTPTAERVLETRGLTVSYGRVVAVDGVSLHARRGEILGLLGPNGAGKTSVIRALTTIVPVTSGTATINGHDLSDPVAVRSSIGVLPESNGYPGAQTALSYLRFYGELFGLSRREADSRAERELRLLGLGDNRNRISTYSRGMRQRLGLARALINQPAVLFLDEPTLGLDPAGQEELLARLARSAAEDGTCVVLCSHLLDEVERVCDRVAIMHHAHIVAEGTVDTVIAESGVAGTCSLWFSPSDVTDVVTALRGSPAVISVQVDNARPGAVAVELRSFDLQGARLSDAFLALTASDRKELT